MRSAGSEVRRLIAAAGVAALLAAAGCRAPGERPEPAEGLAGTARQQARIAQAGAELRSPDAAVRQQAAISLLSMGHLPALAAVLEAMEPDEDPGVRISMIRAAGFCVEHRCFRALLGATGDPNEGVRTEAAAALARFTRPEEVDAMTALAERGDTPAGQRQLVYGALGKGLAIRAVPTLLAGLADDDPGTRAAAWEALRRISNRQLPLDRAQWERWWEDNSQRTREAVLEDRVESLTHELAARSDQTKELMSEREELVALVSWPQPATAKLLLAALGSRHTSVREYSAGRLAALGKEELGALRLDDKDCAALRAAVADESVQVRRNVIRFVAQVEAECRDDLVREALTDDDAVVLTTAIESVRAGLGEDATERMQELLAGSRSREVREAAANALGKVGSAKSAPFLVGALDDSEENVRWFAVEGLRKLHATQAVPRISELLEKDASARVREIAASALGELGQPAGVPALRGALEDRNDRVREKAASALLALATGNPQVMLVIASSFQEHALLAPAEEVLTRVIEQYGQSEEMQGRLAPAYEQLAAVQKQRKEFAAAARTCEKLDGLLGGSAKARSEMVDCWVQGGDAGSVAGAVAKWLEAEGAKQRAQMVDLALDSAERLAESGYGREARTVFGLAVQAAGSEPAPKTGARMEALRRRLGTESPETGEGA